MRHDNPLYPARMTLIASRYQLLKKIASGGMAEVWLAEQRGPGSFMRRVVVKTIHKHLVENQSLVTAFADEARLAGLLHHPHIVRVEDYGEHDHRPFLVMEYLEGHNLKQLASLANGQDTTLPRRLILQMGIQVAEALRYAHQLSDEHGAPLRVVHRDVSPQNIMLSPNGTAKLVDFGIARAASNEGQTQTGTLKGKLAYLSPEQASGQKDIDHRSDQFSLGVVLWELLIGSRLFASDSDVGTLKRVAFGDIPSLALFGRDFPGSLTNTIDRSLRRDRNDRFTDCAEFAKALRVSLSELGGAFADTDYHAWLAKIAGNLSVPKPLPLLDEDAVQRTESVPAVPAQPEPLGSVLSRHELLDEPAEETLMMPVFPSSGNLSEEATQIAMEQVLEEDADAATRVSLRVVGTRTSPSYEHAEAAERIQAPAKGQGKFLLWLLFAALTGVVAVVGFESSERAASEPPAQPPPAVLPESLQRTDQLSKADFDAYVEESRSSLNPCFAKHSKVQQKCVLEITIRSSGKPLSVELRPAKPKLRLCIRNVITKSWRFPSFRGRSVQHQIHLEP